MVILDPAIGSFQFDLAAAWGETHADDSAFAWPTISDNGSVSSKK